MIEACELSCAWVYAGMVIGLTVGVGLAAICVALAVDVVKGWGKRG